MVGPPGACANALAQSEIQPGRARAWAGPVVARTTTLSRVTVTDKPSTNDLPAVTYAPPRVMRTVLLAVVIMVAAVAGVVVGRIMANASPDENSIDAGFSRDMSVHHSQAVEMAMLAADRTTSSEIKVLAHDIALTQQGQIGRMQGWLVSWNLSPTGSRPAMAWMGDGGHQGHRASQMTLLPDGRMPGMASQADLDKLRGLTGRPAEVLFLQLMVAHHRGGIPMAEFAAKHADKAEVRDLANAIAAGQTAELKVLQDKLRARGAAPG